MKYEEKNIRNQDWGTWPNETLTENHDFLGSLLNPVANVMSFPYHLDKFEFVLHPPLTKMNEKY